MKIRPILLALLISVAIPAAANAIKKAYRVRGVPNGKRIQKLGAPWRPYASVACWYLWRSLDGPAG